MFKKHIANPALLFTAILRRVRPSQRLVIHHQAILFVALLALAVILPARTAGAAPMARDRMTTPFSSLGPAESVAIGGITYFTATDATHGRELWKSAGTTT